MATLRQTNFARGELSPLLWGRTDLEVYRSGLRRMRNFFATRHGPAMSRPGTSFVALTKSNGGVRLVPFIYSDQSSYVLEFGHEYIRFHRNGATLLSGGIPYEVATPYQSTDLATLRWVQSGDVLVLTHPSYAPRELTRVSNTNWTLAEVDFSRPLAWVAGLQLEAPLPEQSAEQPAREWSWVVTELRRNSRGVVVESAPAQVTAMSDGGPMPDTVALYPDKPVTITLNALNMYPKTNDRDFIGYLVYRGRGGLFGLVGSSDIGTFTDVGDEPDYSRAPPQGRDPFKVYDAFGTLIRTEYPRAVTYFEERRVFAGTSQRPATIWASATADYSNFDERLVPVADQALEYELASRRRESIQHVVGLRQMLVFTDSSVWRFGGSGGDPLAPDVIPSARVQVEIGASPRVAPLSVEGAALFVRTKGMGVMGLAYEQEREGFTPTDVSELAQHLFGAKRVTSALPGAAVGEDGAITSWTYAEDPWGLVWAVRADGKLLSMTLSGNVWGWAWHDTDGLFLDVCSVPEGDEDAVYVVTRRAIFGSTGAFAIERMTSRVQRDDVDDDVCLDCSLRYSGPPVMTLTGLAAFADRDDVWVIGKDNAPQGPLSVNTAGELTLDELPTANDGANVVLHVGLLYTPELETLDAAPGNNQQKTVSNVLVEVDGSRGLHVGQSFDHLVEWRQRLVSTGYGVPSAATEVVKVNVKGGWDQGARVALRQASPLPLTVLGITRVVDRGE